MKGLLADGWYGGMLHSDATRRGGRLAGRRRVAPGGGGRHGEARTVQLPSLFKALRGRIDLPTVVVITARTLTGWWEALTEVAR